MKTKAMMVLLALTPTVVCGSPASADVPGAHVLASDNAAPAVQAAMPVRVTRSKRRAAGSHETHHAARAALRESSRSQTRKKARRHGSLAAVARHDDGDTAGPAAGDGGKPVSDARDRSGSDAPAFAGTDLIAEARRWIGTNPTGRASLWCARFMNFVLKRAGYAGTSSDMARSFASYGRRLSTPRVGAIVVLTRGRSGGHVGVVTGFDSGGNPKIISGNHSRRVAEAVYPKGRVFAYVVPEK